jgi:S1-C subfamily serine protease
MIVTNKHVVSDTTAEYTVITNDDKEHKAGVLAQDPVNDIAVIKIDGNDYPTLNLGDSDALKIGQTVIAIGNSLGEFTNTVSRGIVSGLKRNVTASGGFDRQKSSITGPNRCCDKSGKFRHPTLDISEEVIGLMR